MLCSYHFNLLSKISKLINEVFYCWSGIQAAVSAMMLTITTSMSAEVSSDMFGFVMARNSSLQPEIFIRCCDLSCCLSTQCWRPLIKELQTIRWPPSLRRVPGELYRSLCNTSLLALGQHLHQVLLLLLEEKIIYCQSKFDIRSFVAHTWTS